jgi:hypothetical protein
VSETFTKGTGMKLCESTKLYGEWFAWDDDRDEPMYGAAEASPDTWYRIRHTGGKGFSERANYETICRLADTARWLKDSDGELYVAGNCTDVSVIEALEGLESYPCLDDDLQSSIMVEAEDAAWDNWAGREFEQDLIAALGKGDVKEWNQDLKGLFFDTLHNGHHETIEESDGGVVFSRWGDIIVDATHSLNLEDIEWDEDSAAWTRYDTEDRIGETVTVFVTPTAYDDGPSLARDCASPWPEDFPLDTVRAVEAGEREDTEILLESGARWVRHAGRR